jgi:predicted MFS family arabinose efflux permease
MDVSLVLSFVGLAAAAATLLGGLFRRWLGLSLLYCHIVLFAVNLAFFWGLADDPWVFIPLAALAAAAGYVAVDSSTPPGPRDVRRWVTFRVRLTE